MKATEPAASLYIKQSTNISSTNSSLSHHLQIFNSLRIILYMIMSSDAMNSQESYMDVQSSCQARIFNSGKGALGSPPHLSFPPLSPQKRWH